MSALNITKDNFEKEVMESTKPVLLDFWADGCTPCKMLSPVIDEIASEHPELTVGKVDADKEKELAVQFGIRGVPSLFVLKNGNVVNKSVGIKRKGQILEMLD